MRFWAGGSDDVDLVVAAAVVIDSNIKKSLNNFDEFHQLHPNCSQAFFFAFDFLTNFLFKFKEFISMTNRYCFKDILCIEGTTSVLHLNK